jgi:hypothetical protein
MLLVDGTEQTSDVSGMSLGHLGAIDVNIGPIWSGQEGIGTTYLVATTFSRSLALLAHHVRPEWRIVTRLPLEAAGVDKSRKLALDCESEVLEGTLQLSFLLHSVPVLLPGALEHWAGLVQNLCRHIEKTCQARVHRRNRSRPGGLFC